MENNQCYEAMNRFVASVEKTDYARFLPLAEVQYGVKDFKISQMTPSNASEIYNAVFIKYV